jgi:RimJ/RimL family protein N-acetyltransferase
VGLPITDGVVTIRAPRSGDAAALVAGRDDQFRRFLGEGASHPRPEAVIDVDGAVVGWVDHDDRDWLAPDECNVGYALSGGRRGRGHATRAVALLLHLLAIQGRYRVATVAIDPENHASLALAERLGFSAAGEVGTSRLLRRPVPPLTYTEGAVTIRRQHPGDLATDLEAKDEEQIRWLWLPGEREHWASMTSAEQRAHAVRGLRANHDAFGHGPKWTFAVDTAGDGAVAYVDCDLANDKVPAGEANVSYATHPAHRGQGLATASVELVLQFLRDHTAAREAHLIVDAENAPSLGVARAVRADERERWTDELGRTMVRHVRVL